MDKSTSKQVKVNLVSLFVLGWLLTTSCQQDETKGLIQELEAGDPKAANVLRANKKSRAVEPLVPAMSKKDVDVSSASGESSDPIKLGMSTALSGPNQYLGLSMRSGMDYYFDEVNRQEGGINGRKIELIVMDDSYNPDISLPNTISLIDEQGVIAIVGNVGTPTANKVIEITNARQVVFYGAFTGASSLRQNPPGPYIFNYRASYREEMEVIVKHIIDGGISPRRIAFLLQDDDYGEAGYSAAKLALESAGFIYTSKLAQARYQTNSLETQIAIKEIIEGRYQPDAIIIVGAYQASASFIRFMHGLYPQTRFYNLSFAGAGALADELVGFSDRVYMTQVVPPDTDELPQCKWPSDMVEREGYLTARLLVAALKNISGEINKKSLRNSLENLRVSQPEECIGELGTKPLVLNPKKHQASNFVVLTQLKNGSWDKVVITNSQEKSRPDR